MSYRDNINNQYLIILMLLIAACSGERSHEKALSAVDETRIAGLEYLEQDLLHEAEAEFQKLIELTPEEALGYANLGLVYLRQNKLVEAEQFLEQAVNLEEDNVKIRLNLYDVYDQMDQPEKAIAQLQKILEYDPENLFALYELWGRQGLLDGGSMTELSQYLERIIEVAPKNIVPRLYLIEFLLENQDYDEVVAQFERIQSQLERLPEDSQELFDQAYDQLINSQTDQAFTTFIMLHNQLKLTDRYQADVRALMGSEDSRVGVPLISFSRKMVGYGGEEENLVYQNIRFTEVSQNAALTTVTRLDNSNVKPTSFISANDLDNDGDLDLVFGINHPAHNQGLYLFSNDLGRFEDVFENSGIDNGKYQGVKSADFDNDGFLDLLFISEGKVSLYHNVEAMSYQNVTKTSGLEEVQGALCALFFDADHDGDLDLFIGNTGQDMLFQNNGTGSFSDVSSQSGIVNTGGPTRDVAIGDYDDDGDIDFFVVTDQGSILYENQRMGRYENTTSTSGLNVSEAFTSVSSHDYNNDGFIDLFLSDQSGNFKLYRNQGKAKFVEDTEYFQKEKLSGIQIQDHDFLDYDNDGFLDLVLAVEPESEQGRGLVLLRNNQQNMYEDLSGTLPDAVQPVHSLSIGDYNEDGDLDLFGSLADGNIGLLRNDGGNMNHQLKIQLVGLRDGSTKNNYFGIGSKVEIRVGPSYQMRTVTSQSEYFGLGKFERADIMRVRWTNGVPQNIFAPHSDRDLIEQQTLKGSCPFLYTWNGDRFVFVKDMMWRSALGMPLGIMTSDNSRAYAFPNASKEYLKIPGEVLKVKDGSYQIKITGELWETIYLDQLALYAIDYPKEVQFSLDEKFVPPPYPGLELFTYTSPHTPVSVTDGRNDLLGKIAVKDNSYISNFKRSDYQGITELKDLIIDLGYGVSTKHLKLFMNGWIFPSDASLNVAMSQINNFKAVAPYLQVINEQGHWETVMENIGFPMGKDKTMVVDLSKAFKTKDRRIRIRTSMQIYWDHIFYAYAGTDFPGTITSMETQTADLQYRGFSREFRKGGRYGPHWFDYSQTTSDPKWMDLQGMYTRYGDVSPLLTDSDDRYVIYNAGDEISINYDFEGLPGLPDGWNRDFIIYSVGWVKDGDLNTAYGQTVTPLPFHGMSSYPYPDTESYPYQENADYLKQYNTRMEGPDQFRDKLKLP